MKDNLNKFFLTMVLLAGMVLTTVGQVTTSSISGKVSDDKNAPLTGATVFVKHVPTGTTYGTLVAVDGGYSISGMRVGGPYEMEISFIGYSSQKASNLFLTVGEEATYNFTLGEKALQIGEIVAIGSKNQKFSSNRTGAQEIFTSETIEKLPTLNRSLSDFTKLTPMSSGGNFGGTSYRYNNVTVDGASFNNSFGLSSALGASGVEPISLEAIDQIQVMIAPYDVRNGAFTGAGINSVTKGGTNDWTGSAYYYFKSPGLEGLNQKTIKLDKANYSFNQKGFSVGGPIIKNKLFLFINGEMDRKETPISWQPSPAKGQQGAGQSIVDVTTLQTFSDYLVSKFEYNPGSYNTSSVPTKADRLTSRLDWNINSKNTLSIKYFYLKSFNTNMPSGSGATGGSRSPSADRIPFSSSYYRTNNNFNIIMADLNTKINDKMSNTLKIGYSALRDFRDMDGGFFPQVDILNGAGWSYTTGVKSTDYVKGTLIATTVGTEENSYNNKLNSDIWQIQDNFTITTGKHRITIGTQSDYRKFLNGYARSFAGVWEFNSFDAFYKEVDSYRAWLAGPKTAGTFESLTSKFTKAYSLQPEFPYAKVDVLSLGLYGQDKWNIIPNLNLTLGLRVDMPIFLTDLLPNAALAAETFQNGIKIDVSKYPKTAPLWSPRLGFNWDVFSDRSLQVRGGTGIFSGTPPYVWISNQAGNNGILFAQLTKPSGALKDLGFDGNPNYGPAAGTAPKADIAFVDPNFKYPTLWKTNIAADKKFGNGWVATVEVLYNKDINNIYHSNVALPNETSADAFKQIQVTANDPLAYDNRVIYTKTSTSAVANSAVMMKNTSKGHSIYTTLQLQKDFDGDLKGLSVNGSYTFGKSMSVTDGSSSVAKSAWQYRPAINPNAEELGYSAGSFPNRLLLSATYSKSFLNMANSSVGIVYQRYSPFRFSYTYNGDLNGDGINLNDLVFIPETDKQISLVTDGTADPRTPAEIWAQLNNFIKQDPYLSQHRGQYSERNGAIAPFVNKVDMNFTQDFFVKTQKGQKNIIRLSFDMVNLGNFINKNWGVEKTTVLGYQQYQFLKMVSKPTVTTAATYTMPYVPAGTAGSGSTRTVLSQTFQDYVSISSRWQMQIGIKYIFK
jgi:hypothetical protein